MRKVIWIPIAVLGAMGAIAWGAHRACQAGVGELKAPINVTEVAALPDGGSMTVVLKDLEGNAVALVRTGSLDVDPTQQSMHVFRWVGIVPMRCSAPKGSVLEAEVSRLLKGWLADKLTREQVESLKRGEEQTLQTIPFHVLGAYSFATWMDRRV